MAGDVTFTREKFKKFKKAYNACKQAQRQSFTFEGHEVLADYARYMLEYLENEFMVRTPRKGG